MNSTSNIFKTNNKSEIEKEKSTISTTLNTLETNKKIHLNLDAKPKFYYNNLSQKDLMAKKLKIKNKLNEGEETITKEKSVNNLKRNSTVANGFRTINTEKKADNTKSHIRYMSHNVTPKEIKLPMKVQMSIKEQNKESYSKMATMISSQRSSMSNIGITRKESGRGINGILTEISDNEIINETDRENRKTSNLDKSPKKDLKSQSTSLFKRGIEKGNTFLRNLKLGEKKNDSSNSLFSNLSSSMLPQVNPTATLRMSISKTKTISPEKKSEPATERKEPTKQRKKNLLKAFRRNAYGFTSDLLKYQKIGHQGISNSHSKMRSSSEDIHTAMDVKNMEMISKKMLGDLEKQLHSKLEKDGPNLKSSVQVNRYLIRDFLIGEVTDAVGSSKKKMKMTTNYLRNKEESTKKRLEMISERFEMLKNFDNPIETDFEIPEATEIKLGSRYSIDKNNILQEYINTKKEHEKKIQNQVEDNSKKLADMILDIDCSGYENIDYDEDNYMVKTVYPKNIERTIRLRNILKNRDDPENDNLGINNVVKFKEQRRLNDNELIKALSKLGNPNFIKTKFKKSTIEKYKVVNGKYFGVQV